MDRCSHLFFAVGENIVLPTNNNTWSFAGPFESNGEKYGGFSQQHQINANSLQFANASVLENLVRQVELIGVPI